MPEISYILVLVFKLFKFPPFMVQMSITGLLKTLVDIFAYKFTSILTINVIFSVAREADSLEFPF